MATGRETLDALKQATHALPIGSTVEINPDDALDLRKLEPDDLVAALRIEREDAERISADLLQDRFEELGNALGLQLVIVQYRRSLIPGEGFRRAAAILEKADDRSLSEMLEEFDRMRHPERYPDELEKLLRSARDSE